MTCSYLHGGNHSGCGLEEEVVQDRMGAERGQETMSVRRGKMAHTEVNS